MARKFLHQDREFKILIQVTADELGLNPYDFRSPFFTSICLRKISKE